MKKNNEEDRSLRGPPRAYPRSPLNLPLVGVVVVVLHLLLASTTRASTNEGECPTHYDSPSETWRNDLQQLVRCKSAKGFVNIVVMRMWNEPEANYFLDFIENEAAGVLNETVLACGAEKYCYMNFPKHFRLEAHGGSDRNRTPLRSPAENLEEHQKLHNRDAKNVRATTCEAGGDKGAEYCSTDENGVEEKVPPSGTGEVVEAVDDDEDEEERESIRKKREAGYLLRHPMKGGIFFLPHPFNQMVVSKVAVNDRTAPVFAFIPKGNLHKLLNLWRNEDRIQLESCQVVKGGLRIVRAVLSIDTTDDDGPRGGRW